MPTPPDNDAALSKPFAPPAYHVPSSFLGFPSAREGAEFHIVGAPFDLGATGRPGQRFGPTAIRRASRMLIDGAHIVHGRNPRHLKVADVGDWQLPLGDLAGTHAMIEREVSGLRHPIVLGGDHSMTGSVLAPLAARFGALAVVHIDAHTDTSPQNSGSAIAHGTWVYRALKAGTIDPRAMVQIGIRAPQDLGVMQWTRAQGITILSAEDVHLRGPEAIADQVRAAIGQRPVYLSFDIDALDPAFAPGTGTPEIGGLATWQAQAILRRLGALRWIGMDMVEVSPPYDHAEVTSLAAATLVWEYLALQAR